MKDVIEARLIPHFVDPADGNTKPNPYVQFDQHGDVIGGEHRFNAGKEAEFDPTLRVDKWSRLPEAGGKRLATYLQTLPWVELRIRPEIEDSDDLSALNTIPRITAKEYAEEQAALKHKAPSSKPVPAKNFIPPKGGKGR